MPILITKARVVNKGKITYGDLLVRKHRIEQIGGSITAPNGKDQGQVRGQKLAFGCQR
jgi:dihydroorotase-like cyclic amidohydrolase